MQMMGRIFTMSVILGVIVSLSVAEAQQSQQQGTTSQRQPSSSQQPQQSQSQQQQRGAQDQQMSSEMIEDLVLIRLAERAWVGGDFTLTMNQGTLTVQGTVPSESSKRRIGRLAESTIGVQQVRNELRVNPASARAESRVDDQALTRRVAESIAAKIHGAKAGEDWWFDGWRVEGDQGRWNIVVDAENGRIDLQGDVPRLEIMRQALDTARNVPGVISVESDFDFDRIYPRYGAYPYYGYHYYGAPYGYAYGAPPYAYPGPYFVHSPIVDRDTDDAVSASPAQGNQSRQQDSQPRR
jgi:osmotically-inducible protein OsmY